MLVPQINWQIVLSHRLEDCVVCKCPERWIDQAFACRFRVLHDGRHRSASSLALLHWNNAQVSVRLHYCYVCAEYTKYTAIAGAKVCVSTCLSKFNNAHEPFAF